MTTTTIPTDRGRTARRGAGFTLVEIMIGATLSTFILAGVLSSFLMLGRSGMNLQNYVDSEAQVRKGLESFSEDVRMASNVTWNSSTSITLTFPSGTGKYSTDGYKVTYYAVLVSNHPEQSYFYRRPGDTSSTATVTTYISGLSSFIFTRYNRLDGAAANNAETKRLQITMNVRKTGQTLVDANTTLVSASFTLRNKSAS